ncbi:MAG: hypothetical protein H0X46_10615 [Bacteroidetes bacterium]|nr:hypothetical protein [Bacteroidota bacterium]
MKKKLFIFSVFLISIFSASAQLEKTTTQVGVSVLPVFNILKFFPDNKISGIAVSVNMGYLTLKNMSVGIHTIRK